MRWMTFGLALGQCYAAAAETGGPAQRHVQHDLSKATSPMDRFLDLSGTLIS